MIEEYFENIYDSAILLGKECGKVDKATENNLLSVGTPFVIYDMDENTTDIWYYPIYMNSEIKFIVVIYIVEDNLTFSVTGEFVNQLNELGYNNNTLIIKEDVNIYLVNQNGNTYLLSENGGIIEEINRDYNELKHYIDENYCTISLSQNIQSISQNKSGIATRSGAIQDINNGKKCIMTNCLVQQYKYNICWAASVATIIRYKTNVYPYHSINAIDVARAVAEKYGIDTSDENNVSEWLRGGDVYDAQLGLALYGVYYSIMNRELSYEELKSEIDNASPIYMRSAYYDEDGNRSGHATVIYGYYHVLYNDFFIMWNPGTAETQTGFYTDENAYYIYNNEQFVWEGTVCNGFIFK